MSPRLRAVTDTNVLISAQYGRPSSANRRFFHAWWSGRFDLLFSQDMLSEYVLKLQQFSVSDDQIKAIVQAVLRKGQKIEIEHFHLRRYPEDPDDIAFILCAINGDASHLVTYDHHLLDMDFGFSFRICPPTPFLNELGETD